MRAWRWRFKCLGVIGFELGDNVTLGMVSSVGYWRFKCHKGAVIELRNAVVVRAGVSIAPYAPQLLSKRMTKILLLFSYALEQHLNINKEECFFACFFLVWFCVTRASVDRGIKMARMSTV